jgi:C4-dicarboxylate transporter, DctM subunit
MINISASTFVILLALRVPIAITLGLVPIIYLLISNQAHLLVAIPQHMFAGVDQFVLMTIPFFILAGNIMNYGNVTTHLIDFSLVLVGHIRGGLALVNVLTSMFFAGTTGSAAAEASAIGSVLIPSMVKRGYSPGFSTSLTTLTSCIGPIIPPSIAFIIYAVMSDTSVAALFLAGVVPGILLGLFLMVYSYFYAVKHNYPREERPSLKRLIKSFLSAFPALMLPIIILGGILTGIFTPTEAAAIAVFYAFLISFFVYRGLKLSDLPRIFIETARVTAGLMLVVACATALAWIMASANVPAQTAKAILSITNNKVVILLLINILFLIMGMILEPIGIMVLFLPVLLPIIKQLDINLIHFGVITVLNLVLGMATPPVGLSLFVCCTIGHISIEETARTLYPMLVVAVIVLFIVTYVPIISLYVPSLFPTVGH